MTDLDLDVRDGPSGPVFVCASGRRFVATTATLLSLLAGLTSASSARAEDVPIAPFATAPVGTSVPPGWEVTTLPKVPVATNYRVVDDDGVHVLRADARGAMAGLTHRLRVEVTPATRLAWRWKVNRVVEQGVFGSKRGDDFAARVYVLFDYDVNRLSFAARMKLKLARTLYGESIPAAALCYVWDARTAEGSTASSPFTERMRMIVATSGADRAGQWVAVTRDVAADFRTAFGEEAPPVIAVALATDTDNTGETVTAWYGDLVLKAR